MTGAMKCLVPRLADAWSGQLLAAGLPFYAFTKLSVPFLEMFLGLALSLGTFARIAVIGVMAITLVATYVHLVVDDPSLFPLQPTAPIIPLVVIAMGTYVLWRGAGSWSLDLRATRVPSDEPDGVGRHEILLVGLALLCTLRRGVAPHETEIKPLREDERPRERKVETG